MYAGMPRTRAASAQGLGVVAAGVRDDAARGLGVGELRTALVAPRYLNAPIFWRFSHLKKTRRPARRSSVSRGHHRRAVDDSLDAAAASRIAARSQAYFVGGMSMV